MTSGLLSAAALAPGAWYAKLNGGARTGWSGSPELYARAEVGAHPASWLSAFVYGQAASDGVEAGIGMEARW